MVLVGLLVWWISARARRIPGWTLLLAVYLFVAFKWGGFSFVAYLLGFPRLYRYGSLFSVALVSLEFINIAVIHALSLLAALLLDRSILLLSSGGL